MIRILIGYATSAGAIYELRNEVIGEPLYSAFTSKTLLEVIWK